METPEKPTTAPVPVPLQRLVRCSCCGDGFAPQDTKDGYCQTCHPDADMYSDPDGKLDFGGEDGIDLYRTRDFRESEYSLPCHCPEGKRNASGIRWSTDGNQGDLWLYANQRGKTSGILSWVG